MGCDIHLVLEMKYNSEWLGVHSFERCWGSDFTKWPESPVLLYRNYELFGALAGVRRDGPPPRGTPQDISPLARKRVNDYGVDEHSHTWYTLDEISELLIKHCLPADLRTRVLKGALIDHSNARDAIGKLINVWINEEEKLSDYRLIIWFDN